MNAQFHIGTSGWQYRDWKGSFYPEDLASKDQLSYYAKVFNTVEINSTFYHLPRVSTCKKWHDETPENFVFTLKLYRGITHLKRLKLDDVSLRQLADFCTSAAALQDKLGMILVQLPPSFKNDLERLNDFVLAVRAKEARLGVSLPLAIEVRHESWFDEEIFKALDRLNVAWVINDSPNRWPSKLHTSANQLYIRFHGNQTLYKSSYTKEELTKWASYITGQNVGRSWVYFNNDFGGVGPQNAVELQNLLLSENAKID